MVYVRGGQSLAVPINSSIVQSLQLVLLVHYYISLYDLIFLFMNVTGNSLCEVCVVESNAYK